MTASPPLSSSSRPVRVFVVDDDFKVAELHCRYLEGLRGFEVVGQAHRGREALAAVAALKPDLVLLDIYLPDISGIEVLRRLRASAGPPVDVIVITAARDVDTLREVEAGGVFHYLVKPFSRAAFREYLEGYVVDRAQMLHLATKPGIRLTQGIIDDRLRRRLRTRNAPNLPTGLSPRTLDLVIEELCGSGGDLSASEVADRCTMSRETAGRYLRYLAGAGRAAVRPRLGQPGRPEDGYRWIG